ncbi:MAG: type II toxin-antitoxin system RelE/ParE family toxin [Chloroflexota bacterium]|nr:type II toxin-antitoxin system RelE/ParE family toxin [Chloroflexota bacterium]
MARYDVRFRASVRRDLRRIPDSDVRRILARIESLRDDPRPPGSSKLAAQETYRIRQGTYRVVYTVADTELIVEVVKVGHRRDVYRDT